MGTCVYLLFKAWTTSLIFSMRRRWDKSKNLTKGQNYVWNISFQVSLWFLKLPNFSLLRKRSFNVFLLNQFEPSYSIHFDISPLDPLFPICLLSVTSRYWNAKKTSAILPPILSRGVEIQVFFSILLSFFNLSVVKKKYFSLKTEQKREQGKVNKCQPHWDSIPYCFLGQFPISCHGK